MLGSQVLQALQFHFTETVSRQQTVCLWECVVPPCISVNSWSFLGISSTGYLRTLLSAIYLGYIPEPVIEYHLVPLLRPMNKKPSFFAPTFLSFFFFFNARI